jgi:hypothetical protein
MTRSSVPIVILSLLLLIPLPTTLAEDGEPLADEPTRFTDVTEDAGFRDDMGMSRVAWGDYDGDGWEDLLLNGRSLWRNDRDGTFTDVTAAAGIKGVNGVGGIWADIDNDGDLDFYTIVRSFTARDALWRNDGDGTFTDVTTQSGEIWDYLPTEGAAWGDYDNNGYVDLYVANYETASASDEELGIGTPDVLYRNLGDGTFENVTRRAGIELDGEPLCGRGVSWCDYDDDGDLDIYVSNYRLDPNLLWRNDEDGTFVNVARQTRTEGYASDSPLGGPRYGHTIGSDFGDYDNDGDMDLYASNLAHPRFIMFSDKCMLLNNRGGDFVDRFYGSGIAYCETSSDPAWGDFDNDGDLDLYFTAVYEGVRSRLFRNIARDRFEDATGETRTSVDNGWGCAWCDYDHDGDLDLAVGSGTGFRLLENEGNANRWLQVELEGTYSNKAAIGARVRVRAGDLEMIRDVQGGRGTTSQNMLACHFGLGDHGSSVEVLVRWPGETVWVNYGTFGVDQRVSIVQGDVGVDASVALEADPDDTRVGDVVDLVAFVENEGEATIDSAGVIFTVQGVGPVGPAYPVGPIGPGETTSASGLWQPTLEGVYTVVAELVDVTPADTNPDNDVSQVTVVVRGSNAEPIARLKADVTEGPPGTTVTFDASESSDDTGVEAYMFEFGDDTISGWQSSPVAVHGYTHEGEFLASLTVQDLDGVMSTNFATVQVRITSQGYRPIADIITILPNPAREGEPVTLHGKGTASEGAGIERHTWNSSRDGPLGDGALISVSTLSTGEHTIIYKVQDSRGLWSDPATENLVVLPPEGTWELVIEEPREGTRANGDKLVVAGRAAYSAGLVVSVEVRLDNGPWELAKGSTSWSLVLDISDLADGYHTVRVRALSLDSASDTLFVNFTRGELTPEPGFDLREWLLTWQGITAVVALAIIINIVVWMARTRRRRSRA